MNTRKSIRTGKTSKPHPTADSYVNMVARLGYGADNLKSRSTYTKNPITRDWGLLEAIYRGSWIAGVAIDCIADDMTRAGIEIHGENTPEEVTKLQRALVRGGVWRALNRLIKWGRLYGGAAAVIDIDGQKQDEPLRMDSIAQGQPISLKVYDCRRIYPDMTNMIHSGIEADLPRFYDIPYDPPGSWEGELPKNVQISRRIHHSRAIRSIGIELPYWEAMTLMFWGESIIERIYDRLNAFDQISEGAANLAFRAYVRTVGVNGLNQTMSMGGKAEENLIKRFQYVRLMQNNEGLTLLDKEDTFQAHSYTFSGLSDLILQAGQQISGAIGVPLVRLFGQSPAGLNATGESDIRNYYDHIRARQEADLRMGLLKILEILHLSLFGRPISDDFDFEFTPLWQTSEKEKADINSVNTNAILAAHDSSLIDAETAMKELKQLSDSTGIFTNITDEKIQEAKDLPPPTQALGMPPPAPNSPPPLEKTDIPQTAA